MEQNAVTPFGTGAAAADVSTEQDAVVVHVQLRPRRGSTRRCLAALAELAGSHPEVAFSLTGLSKDDRVVRVTVGVELGPRTAVAKFSPQAQAAYGLVSALFTTLYDHMPVYTAEPGGAERAAAADLMARLAGATAVEAPPAVEEDAAVDVAVPAPRRPSPLEQLPA